MRVSLVTALTMSDFVDPDTTLNASTREHSPQLGILCVAASLLAHGHDVEIVNLDELFIEFISRRRNNSEGDGLGDFFPFVTKTLSSVTADVVGFSSICSTYPLTIRLADFIRPRLPEALIVLGGPQASVVDEHTLRDFPFVDAIVRGEADETFPQLLQAYQNDGISRAFDEVPGITYSYRDEIIRNAENSLVRDLDTLPIPAFHLDPSIHKRRGLHLEAGRGCPYACTFCSTNDFFRRNYRLKSTKKMLSEMRLLRSKYGVTHFSLVHDMYTIDREKVIEFCEGLIEANEGFVWSCSARTDRIDDELIDLMAQSGCEGIFFGIETGSQRLQSVINKNLKLEDATARIRHCSRKGISTAVALISAFPDETKSDLRDTVHYFVNSLRYSNAEPQLSLLAPLAQTPLEREYRDQLVLDHLFSDMSHQGWRRDAVELEMVARHPSIFPNFYSIPTKHLPRRYFKDVHDFVVSLTAWFRWLPVAMLSDTGDFLDIFDAWRAWADEQSISTVETNGAAPYYSKRDFPTDFLRFLHSRYLHGMSNYPAVVSAVAEAELFNFGKSFESRNSGMPLDELSGADDMNLTIPFIADSVRFAKLPVNYGAALRRLRDTQPISGVPDEPVTVAFQRTADDSLIVRQLTHLSAAVLDCCDGERTVADVARVADGFRSRTKLPIRSEIAVPYALLRLRDQGIVGFRHPKEHVN